MTLGAIDPGRTRQALYSALTAWWTRVGDTPSSRWRLDTLWRAAGWEAAALELEARDDPEPPTRMSGRGHSRALSPIQVCKLRTTKRPNKQAARQEFTHLFTHFARSHLLWGAAGALCVRRSDTVRRASTTSRQKLNGMEGPRRSNPNPGNVLP